MLCMAYLLHLEHFESLLSQEKCSMWHISRLSVARRFRADCETQLPVLTKSEIISRFALNGFKADMKRLELTIENCILTPEVALWGGV